jgi:hypothetical protein
MSCIHGFMQISLILNIETKIVILFHTRQERDLVKTQIKFGNIGITYKSETKFLSIHTSEYIKLDAHVRSLSSKLSIFYYD